jgi:serine/threonine protein kinase
MIGAIFVQVAHGLNYLHGKCLRCHRDVKPHNLLVSESGRVKLADFGVVSGQLQNTLHETSTFCGTLLYMAPERLKGKSHSFASDVWALGCTVHELACGTVPFPNTDGFFELLTDVTGRDRRPFDPRLSIGRDLEGMVDACLVKEPDQRATAGALLSMPFFQAPLAMPVAERDRVIMEWIRSLPTVKPALQQQQLGSGM